MFSWSAKSQNTISNKKPSKKAFAEKIYLQLSNTVFTTGEAIWYKAIVTNTINQFTKRSSVLYVDLIDFDENIIDTKTLKLENGLSDGFFDLSDTLPSGRYLIRAYTQWNRNFGQDFIYEHYIDVLSLEAINNEAIIRNIALTETNDNQLKLGASIFPEGLKADYNKDLKVYIQSEDILDSIEVKRKNKQYVLDYILPKDLITVKLKVKLEDTKLKNRKRKKESTYSKTIALNKDFLDLQFFPEGGKLIDGFTNKVGYKSINYKGLGEAVSGHIVDESDNVIGSFSTNILGMGFTFFKPRKNKTYYGKIISEKGVAYKYPLPQVMAKGYILNVMETQDYLRLNIKSNIKNTDSLYFQVRSRGVLIREHSFKLKQSMHEAFIKKTDLPNGIVNITLFTGNDAPVCERLIFNYKEEKILNITAKTDKNFFGKREKTTLHVSVSDIDSNPVEANFSALVLDKKKLGSEKKAQPNMLSYFLLNSELKGFIENPNHYFNADNTLRKRDIEALMLTQGWRDYVYDKTDTDINFEFQPETDIFLSGRVNSVFNKNKIPKKPVNLTMVTKPSLGIYTTETDSLGTFAFNMNNHFADEQNILIQSTNKRGAAKNYNITLNDPIAPPKVNYKTEETVTLADTIYKAFIEESIVQYNTNNDFKTTSETVALDAVELTGYNVTPEREKIFKLHGPPDVVIENEELVEEEEKWMSGLYDLLRIKFPHDIAFRELPRPFGGVYDIAYVTKADLTVYYIDGEVVLGRDYLLLPYLSIENIKSVEILERPKGAFLDHITDAFPRMSAEGQVRLASAYIAVVSIYTYGSSGLAALESTKGIFQGKVSGFSAKREFYAPKYDKLEDEDWNVPDLRSVIHWKPLAQTDEDGNANVEFYNGDNIGDMLVVIEAISLDGKIGYFETTYNVEEKNEN
ncbi:TonB-dependent receptor plug domain-containing protein [Algibacter aquimarinus]|uniref:TonB-dependent receptor plug domain-containing protein n=1 Tax=Algibacter aquimarinus TaxID=1136748 RepID=A0ABP9HC95_9FLAO